MKSVHAVQDPIESLMISRQDTEGSPDCLRGSLRRRFENVYGGLDAAFWGHGPALSQKFRHQMDLCFCLTKQALVTQHHRGPLEALGHGRPVVAVPLHDDLVSV